MSTDTQKTFVDSLKSMLGLSDKPADPPQANPEVASLKADLETANKKIVALDVKFDAAAIAHKAAIEAKDKEISDIKASVDKQASDKAARITASQGQPPIVTAPAGAKTAAQKIGKELTGLARATAAHEESYGKK